MKTPHLSVALIAVVLFGINCTKTFADPLPGEVLKFQQLPLNQAQPPSANGQPYAGHDTSSTANLQVPGGYVGTFVADDFADKVSTPVVHVSWWGSYLLDASGNPQFGNAGVQKFLIAFESDVPAVPPSPGNPGSPSHPGTVLSTEEVTLGLTPASGTFTETLINGSVPEHLFHYNAELKSPFPEQADTVYWLKIAALVDPTTDGNIDWGWHNRDWGIQDVLASNVPSPGEHDEGPLNTSAGNTPVYHFQDDAGQGRMVYSINTAGTASLQQFQFTPLNYSFIAGAVNSDGPPGIQNFSEDMAFELYTTPVPEPAAFALFGMGGIGLVIAVRRRINRRTNATLASE